MFMFENHRFDLKLMEYFYLSGMRSKSKLKNLCNNDERDHKLLWIIHFSVTIHDRSTKIDQN